MTNSTSLYDQSIPFMFEASEIRGRIVRMDETLSTILSRHDYPEAVSGLLGELTVLAGLLAGALKYEGVFSLQIRGDGPVSMMVADCTNDGEIRAYARFESDRLVDGMSLQELVGKGTLSLHVSQVAGENYQGIVELAGPSLTAAMLVYFKKSEQIDTGIDVHVEKVDAGIRAGGVIVQRMPGTQDDNLTRSSASIDDWRRTMLLLNTLTHAELTDTQLSPDDVLYRLFHEEEVRIFDRLALRFGCRCSEDRLRSVIANFGHDERGELLDDDGMISANCQFCNETYQIDPAQLTPAQ